MLGPVLVRVLPWPESEPLLRTGLAVLRVVSPVRKPEPLKVRVPELRVSPRVRVPERERVLARTIGLVPVVESVPPEVVKMELLPPRERLLVIRRVP